MIKRQIIPKEDYIIKLRSKVPIHINWGFLFKIILSLVLSNLFYSTLSAQIVIRNSNYTSWEGKSYQTYLIESKHAVINIDKNEVSPGQIEDLTTLSKIINRVDTLYGFYKYNLGYEPAGGNPDYGNKVNVFFGPPSCGSGCGLIGAKGIEISGFQNIFFNLKHGLNVNRDVIIGYEFGRNFFDFASKILFPFVPNSDERNGGFAEGFANIMYLYAYDDILTESSERELNETLLFKKWGYQTFLGYINDTTATPYNSLHKWEKSGVLDANRGLDGWNYEIEPAYSGFSILSGIFEVIGKDKLFPKFFQTIRQRPSATTVQDALSNIAYAASISSNKNLIPFFKNALKFTINPEIEREIALLPKMESKLIRDLPTLWFVSPIDTIKLNLRGTNYLEDGAVYKVIINGKEYSSSKHGNNSIPYSILGKNNEIKAQCSLIINQTVVDSYEIVLKKRHNVNLFDYKSELYAYYLSNKSVKSYFEGNTLVLEQLDKNIHDGGMVSYNIIFPRDRVLEIEGEIRQIAISQGDTILSVDGLPTTGYSNFGIFGPGRINGSARVGYDLGLGDNDNYYKIKFSDQTNLFMPADRKYFMNRLSFINNGYGVKSYFKNITIKDITDIDGDGIVDFEDECPLEAIISTIATSGPTTFCQGDKVTLSASEGSSYLWSTGATTRSIEVSTGGNYSVTVTNANGCSATSTATTVTVNPLPTAAITASGPTTFCQGSKVTLTASEGSSYLWSTGATTRSIEVSTSGNYTVTVTNSNGCSATSSATAVTVSAYPVATITAAGPTTITQTGNVVLSANTGTGFTYQWYKDGLLINTATSSTYTATTGGSYTVKVINATGCETLSSATIVKTVFVLPANNYQVNVQGETCRTSDNGKVSISAVQNLNYTATISRAGLTIKTTNFNTTAELSSLTAGSYTLCITVAGQSEYKQCYDITITEPEDLSVYTQVNLVTNTLDLTMSGSDSYTINLNGQTYTSNSPRMSLALSAGLNKLTVNATQACQGVYTEEIYVDERVELYPNPFTSILNIKIENQDNKELNIKVLNGSGVTVYQARHRVNNKLISLDLSQLESGYYFVVIGKQTYKAIKK